MAPLCRQLVAVIAAGLALAGCASTSGQTTQLTVAGASSLTKVLPELVRAYEQDHASVKIQTSLAGTSTIVEQLKAGAPIDVLLGGSGGAMDSIADQFSSSQAFAGNQLIVVVPRANPGNINNFQDLRRPGLRIATCMPKVPCGDAAVRLFKQAGLNITPISLELDDQSVLGRVSAGEVDAGIVYVTDAASDKSANGILIPEDVNVRVEYLGAVSRDSKNAAEAKRFADWLLSAPAQLILQKYGFLRP